MSIYAKREYPNIQPTEFKVLAMCRNVKQMHN